MRRRRSAGMPRPQLAEARRHLDDAERLALEFRALLRVHTERPELADRVHAPRHDGAAPAHRGTAEPPAATPHGEHAAGNAPPTEHCAAAQQSVDPAVLLALLDDDELLKAKFDELADSKGSNNQPLMSKQALSKAMGGLGNRDLSQIDELMEDDGNIGFHEFQLAVRNSSPVEKLLQGLPILRAIALQLGGSIDEYTKMTQAQVQTSVSESVPLLVEIINKNIAAIREANETSAREHGKTSTDTKFSFVIQGGGLEQYHGGVTEKVGEPHADIAKGMEIEHLHSGDSDIPFKTGNYGIVTTPRQEYMLVVSGGEGLKAETVPRVLRPLHYYQKLQTVKDAGLSDLEIIGIILYTGPMFQVTSSL